MKRFKQGEVDFITTIDKHNPEKVLEFGAKIGASVHSTMNIRTFLLGFSSKGKKKYAVSERLRIGNTLKTVFRKHYANKPGYEPTDQFFPPYGDGALNDDNKVELQSVLDRAGLAKEAKNFVISIVRLGDVSEFKEMIEKALPGAIVIEGKSVPDFIKYASEDEMPDAFIAGPDSGFLEDINLISYSVNSGMMAIQGGDSRSWLDTYMHLPTKEERLNRLRELHFENLKNGVTVPLVSAPYVAMANPEWNIKLSQLFANNPLWLIRVN